MRRLREEEESTAQVCAIAFPINIVDRRGGHGIFEREVGPYHIVESQ